MTPDPDVEQLAESIEGLGESVGETRDALTVVPGRLHMARGPDRRFELFLEGDEASFGSSAVGKGLEFGEFVDLGSARHFTAVVIRAGEGDSWVRPMAHVAYEAFRALRATPDIDNESLLEVVAPYLGLVHGGSILSLEQQVGLSGEMLFLEVLLNAAEGLGMPAHAAIERWTGWDSASRDFKGEGVAVEVKATQSPDRSHWVHPLYQLLPNPDEAERVYVFSVGLRIDRSRSFQLLSLIDRVTERLDGGGQGEFVERLGHYAGVGFDVTQRRRYQLEPGLVVTHPSALFRVDHLTDILRPETFVGGGPPARVNDLRYRVSLEGLAAVSGDERAELLRALLAPPR